MGGQERAGFIVKVDVGSVFVVAVPQTGIQQGGEDFRSGKILDDDLVGSKVVRGAGQVVLGPLNFMQHNNFLLIGQPRGL